MQEGLIVKGIGGFYYVKCGEKIYSCRARGKFRKDIQTPFVGDRVKIRLIDGEEGYVEEIEPRKNCLIRPPIANIDRLMIVAALKDPKPDTVFIDKLLVICAFCGIKPILCFNKVDLNNNLTIPEVYRSIGYPVQITSTKENHGVQELKAKVSDGITAVAGFSGVGKSSLLNMVDKSFGLKTGGVSEKLQRGKHTTRHVELYELESGGYLADTPGFSNLDIDMVRAEELPECYPEFALYAENCRFADCTHTKEKGCSVLAAEADGKIASFRLESYRMFYERLKEIKEWERK